ETDRISSRRAWPGPIGRVHRPLKKRRRVIPKLATHPMWILKLALRRPYTFVVAALLLLLLTPFVLLRTPTDIFPNIEIRVISVIWQYAGLSAQEIEQRIIYTHERTLTATVND